MYCTKCGVELRESDSFCSRCGTGAPHSSTGTNAPVALPVKPVLMLDKQNKKLAGVCAGFARYLAMDRTLVRVIWLAVAIGTGFGFLAYLIAWLVMPSDRYARGLYNYASTEAITARPSPTC